jgi:uncharacterized OB-fold protein
MGETESQRPLPDVTGEAGPFWQACSRHELLLQRCRSCQTLQFYPRALCSTCWSTDLAWEPSTGSGSIYSFTIVHRAPTPVFAAMTPYVIALVSLDDGVRMLSHIVGAPANAVQIGARVKLAFDDLTDEVSLPVFELA